MDRLYSRVDVGEPAQYVGVHPLKWQRRAIEPDAAFVEYDEEPMPCGHPRGCVQSASHAEGVATTCHCGWCASIARAEAAEKQLAEAQRRIAKLEHEVDGLRYLLGYEQKYREADDGQS